MKCTELFKLLSADLIDIITNIVLTIDIGNKFL